MSNANLLRWATYASVSTAGILIGLKLYAWINTDSVAILASLVDSIMDILASGMSLIAIAQALKPADDEHRFGHGKVEALAGLGQSLFIAGSGVFLIYQSLERFSNPQPIHHISAGSVVMIISIILTALLLAFQYYVIRKTGSTAVKADALHYRADLITNVAILLALALASIGIERIDPFFAFIIAFYVLYSAAQIALEAIQMLIDRELPEQTQQLIESIALKNSKVRGIHELRTRQSGLVRFIQFHIDIDKNTSLEASHIIADEVEIAIKQAIDNADVMIHQDPV
ncbi:MAG: divalent metal cation transporter FieF [Gammaproteobacteria bacterium]|nr:MAG: divalent metal cation transporter FieF [Gammaproteobacteria bacterium]